MTVHECCSGIGRSRVNQTLVYPISTADKSRVFKVEHEHVLLLSLAEMTESSRRKTPEQDAVEHITLTKDKPFLEARFINTFKGKIKSVDLTQDKANNSKREKEEIDPGSGQEFQRYKECNWIHFDWDTD
ncbi:hypothetical protein NHX12_015091 [Muraenolepis orangiensis]|uniref:Uncharacterized protein n=1 Tax=Muraenolepis orangiensis TaxID=630683 RepID=A0A9Q0DB94_9TELE|nr:hypothetical protein NHX12_015091 [Muraenolepis orangiensis]